MFHTLGSRWKYIALQAMALSERSPAACGGGDRLGVLRALLFFGAAHKSSAGGLQRPRPHQPQLHTQCSVPLAAI